MKRRFFAMLLSLAMLFTLAPTAFALESTAAGGGQTEIPELEKPATSGTSGGIDWKVENGTLTISPSATPENSYNKGKMVENYGTLTKKDPGDEDYIATLKKAGYEPSSQGYFYYPNSHTWVSDSPWKFLSEKITKVVIEDGVTSIAARAFRLPNVTEVSIPASVISIGKLAFEACEKLDTVHWTGKWEGHAPMAFNGFSRCSSLGNGYELTNWMPACFYVNANSDSIEGTQFTVDFDKLNGRLRARTTYPLAMFRSVPKITSATLTSQLNVKYIFEYSGIQSVTIANDQSSIAEAAFRNCKSLTSVVIPSSVTEINLRAFGDSGLKNITFSGLTSPTFGSFAFENVKLDSLTLNENMSLTEAVKIIGALAREGAITDNTTITPAKFANFDAENVVVDGAEGEAINHQSYPLVKNLTINGAYISAASAFGNSNWGQETLENLTIQAPGKDVTINATAFLRTPLKSVKIEANKLTFTGDAAFLNTMLLTRVDLTGVDQIVAGEGAKRTFELNTTGDYGTLKVPTRYVYFKNADTYNALAQGGLNKHFLGNTSTYYLVTNGGTVVGEQDGFSAVVKGGYTAEWHAKADFSDTAVTTPVAGNTYYANWVPRQLSSIEVVAKNTNVPYGTVLSANDFTVTAVYDNGEREQVTDFSLSPNTELKNPGTVQVKVTYQDKTAICNITVDKASQAAPANAPTLKDRTYTSITLNTVEPNANGAVAQYSKDGGKTWQDSAEFTDLTSNTTYTFAVRYAEKAPYAASTASATAEFSTLRHSSGSSSSNPTYSVTTPSKSENGKVSLDKSTAKKGDTVTVTVTPDAGYQLDKLTVTDKNGNVLKLTDKGDGKYSFTMPDGKVEVKAVFAKKVETSPFGDVSTDAYYYKAVQWAQEKGITDGISSNLFGPKQPCTRSQIVTFLWRAAGSPEPKGTAAGMTDVVPGSYYAKAVAWAVENGITTGTAEGTFSPDATCTRAQAVTFLARAQNAKATGKTAFSDVPADSYFADAVAWAQANGVTTGTSETTFSPDNDCTRAQIVTFLYRANQGT